MNCATLPSELIEIELFGVEKGYLPGINSTRKGKLELMDQGTLLIESLDEMPKETQLKIVHFLKNGQFTRIGSHEIIETNVRLLFTSIYSVENLISQEKLILDLSGQLQNHEIEVLPLRNRTEDILPLIYHFSDIAAKQMAQQRKTISEQGLKLLLKHEWPANIRELKNFIERVYILTPTDFVDVHDLKFAGLVEKKNTKNLSQNEFSTFRDARAEFEKDFLIKKIQEFGGNISKTAEAIGLERSYLHRKIKAYGIEVSL